MSYCESDFSCTSDDYDSSAVITPYPNSGKVTRQTIATKSSNDCTHIENKKFHNELDKMMKGSTTTTGTATTTTTTTTRQKKGSPNRFSDESISDRDDDGESIEIPPSTKMRVGTTKKSKKISDMSKQLLWGGILSICLLVIIVIIISVGITKGLFFSSSEVTDGGNSVQDIIYPSSGGSTERANRLREYLITVVVNGAATFIDPISPESQALTWMQYEDPIELDSIKLEHRFRIEQRFALLTLWFQSDFDWYNETNWLTEDECTWKGVTCTTVSTRMRRSLLERDKDNDCDERILRDGDTIVNTINLEQNNLQGNLPPDLSLLKNLASLNLSRNQLSGTVPEAFSPMNLLEELYLDNNNLSRELFLDFSLMSSLTTLDLSNNQFEGNVPDSLYSITTINHIRLDNNNFIGRISDDVGNLINLSIFTADSNQLYGPIPVAFGSLGSLENLSLRDNLLTGGISTELLSATTLVSLDLSNNTLAGSVPSFSMMENLTTLSLGYNDLSGELNFGSMRNLKEVVLEKNKFAGRFPDLSDSPWIQILRLGENNFDSQAFPTYILRMTNMTNLGLNNLSLTGAIPVDVGTWTRLTTLNLEDNLLSGNIPLSIAGITPLKELTIHKNQLTGNIPFEISFLRNLEKLTLSSNKFDSNIPIAIGALTSLKILTMESNFLEGRLPASLRFLSNLEVLNLADNGFTGSIPYAIWNMSSLRQLILTNNNLVGQIPGSVENLKQLQVLNIGSNTLRGRIPDSIVSLRNLLVLDLSFNFFGGPIPEKIGDLVDLRELLLGTNYDDSNESFGLDGTIPVSIAAMTKLERLELNRNRFSGMLPSQHGLLNLVQVYDVSDNKQLGGTVPANFRQMSQLNELKIIDTNIEGTIPVSLCDMGVVIEVGCSQIECNCCECS